MGDVFSNFKFKSSLFLVFQLSAGIKADKFKFNIFGFLI